MLPAIVVFPPEPSAYMAQRYKCMSNRKQDGCIDVLWDIQRTMVVAVESDAVAVAVRSESVGNAESDAAVAEATSDESCLLSFFFNSTSVSRKRCIQGCKVAYR